MFLSIPLESTAEIGAGEFACPHCNAKTNYSHNRVVRKRMTLIFFIPIWGVEEILGEFVQCATCHVHLEPSILLDTAVGSEIPAKDSSLRNVVTLSDAAAMEIGNLMANGGYEPGTYVRVIPDPAGCACDIKFDLPYADNREWLGRDHGFSIVIDRELADVVSGLEIDFDGHSFRSRPRR